MPGNDSVFSKTANGIYEAETPTKNAKDKNSLLAASNNRELEAFGVAAAAMKQPVRMFRKTSSNGREERGGTPKRVSPNSQKSSFEGRQSLQMAGSEAMNFMIATNYSAAKVKLE